MKKYTIEIAIIENGTITGWDPDAVQETVNAESAAEAIELAKDYIRDCIRDNGLDPDKTEIILRAAEMIGDERSEWIYDED
jgi:hypothetical protein